MCACCFFIFDFPPELSIKLEAFHACFFPPRHSTFSPTDHFGLERFQADFHWGYTFLFFPAPTFSPESTHPFTTPFPVIGSHIPSPDPFFWVYFLAFFVQLTPHNQTPGLILGRDKDEGWKWEMIHPASLYFLYILFVLFRHFFVRDGFLCPFKSHTFVPFLID